MKPYEPDRHPRALSAPPRLLWVDLSWVDQGSGADSARARVAFRREPWRGSTPALDRVGRAGGTALAAALLHDRAPDPEAVPLVVAVGGAVRRGLPTAARATLASRAPLTGLFADGQVGSDLGRRLASVCDALVIAGRAPEVDPSGRVLSLGRVLLVRGDGEVRLHELPELAGRSSRATHAALAERFGNVATLSIGPAGEARLPCASLAAGGDPPHFVGRGGLGAVLGRLGLKALVIDAPLAEAEGDPELMRLLSSSPRLLSRAEGGTLELFDDLAARSAAGAGERTRARRVADEVAAAPSRRHGCRGCPTPCGFEFETRRGAQGARFGAARALGLELGLERFEQALELLAACDRVGVDAKEVGAALALLARAREERGVAGPRLLGRREALLEAIEDLGGARAADGALLAGGALALARALGLEGWLRHARGGALETERGLASLLGQCASSRGADPMRTFPFLAADAADGAALAALVAPLPLPEGALDPARAAGKGRLVWWHEHLALALDASGFCAFSAAALLADGVASPGALARRIAPEALRRGDPGSGQDPARASDAAHAAAFLAGGEQTARLLRILNRRWAGPGAQGLAEAARRALAGPGLWPEYAVLRGLDPSGDPTPSLAADFEAGRATDAAAVLGAPPGASPPAPGGAHAASPPAPGGTDEGAGAHEARRPGRAWLRSSGPLARVLGRERELALALPAPLEAVLARAAAEGGDGARALLGPGRPAPVVYRDGARLLPGALVRDGDRLDLLLVISGGSR